MSDALEAPPAALPDLPREPTQDGPKIRLYLVDGSGYIFRASFGIQRGMKPMTRSDGTPTGAVYQFTRMVLKLVDEALVLRGKRARRRAQGARRIRGQRQRSCSLSLHRTGHALSPHGARRPETLSSGSRCLTRETVRVSPIPARLGRAVIRRYTYGKQRIRGGFNRERKENPDGQACRGSLRLYYEGALRGPVR